MCEFITMYNMIPDHRHNLKMLITAMFTIGVNSDTIEYDINNRLDIIYMKEEEELIDVQIMGKANTG